MASHGGTISIDADQLATTLVSGPIGGVVGARWLADEIGLHNVLCTDIGGTSLRHRAAHRHASTRSRRRPTWRSSCSTCRSSRSTPSARAAARSCASTRTRGGRRSAPTRRARRSAPRGPRAASRPSRSPTSTSCSAASTRTTSSAARSSSTSSARGTRSSARSPTPLGLGVEEAAAGVDRAVRDLAAQRGGRPDPRQGLLAGRLHAALLRRRRPAARRRLHRGRALPAGARARVGGGLQRLRLRVRGVRVPLRPPGRPAAAADPVATRSRSAWSRCSTAGLARARGPRARGVREVRLRPATTSRFTHMVRMQYYGQLVDIEVDSPKRGDRVARGRRRR